MRLDFNVLWVENLPKNVEAQRKRIDLQIRKQGFRLQAEFATSIQEARKYLADDIYGDHIDVVLMDYDLGVGEKGDVGLVEVRDAFPYKDIVFYSAQGNDLLKLVANKKIQGIFCSIRDNLPDSVIGVFTALVKKVVDIDHSRGIVMGASSDIDHLVNECLMLLFERNDTSLIGGALEMVSIRMTKKQKDWEKATKEIAAIKQISEIMNHHRIYTSDDRLGLLRKILAKTGDHSKECEAMKHYSTDTIPKRNILAHVEVQREGFRRKLLDRKTGKELTGGEMQALRSALLSHQEMFEGLVAKLKPASADAAS